MLDEDNELDIRFVEGIEAIASALRNLGNGDAATELGALEALGMIIKEGMDSMAGALYEIAE